MDDKKISLPSLKSSIQKGMVGVTSIFMILSTLIVGYLSYDEAKEQQDELLIEIAKIIENRGISLGHQNKLNISLNNGNDEAVAIVDLTSISLPSNLITFRNKSKGLHTLPLNGSEWRIYIGKEPHLEKIHFMIAQRTEVRNEYALNNCLSFTIPTIILLVLLLITINHLINLHFNSLERLGIEIANKNPTDFEPLSQEGIFLEILPFYKSINENIKRTKEYISHQNLFIANAAHELRTPITAISLQLENLINSNESEREERQAYITLGLTRLKIMLKQLLDLAKLDKQYISLGKKSSFLNIIKSVVSDLYPLIEQKNINIEVNSIVDLYIYNHTGELDCLVKNAVENAIKFSNTHSDILISLQCHNGCAVFTVENYDISTPESEFKNLLEPFYKLNQEKEGSGLGLSICNKIAEKLNGKLKIEKTEYNSFKFIYTQEIAN